MAKDLAIVLNNGSINSAVTTALAAQRFRPILLHVEAVQQPGSRIRAAYDMQVAHFKPYREHTLPMPFLTTFHPAGMSTSSANDPRTAAMGSRHLVELLPLIAAAARYCVHYQAAAIYLGLRTGNVADDLAQATEFAQIWNELIQMPCEQSEVEVLAPLLELEPWQVIDVGFQVSAPFDRTWSCVEDASDPC